MTKSGKKLSKSRNLPNFDVKKNEPSFLTSDTKMDFNRLRLAFIKDLILWHFDSEYHLWIETNALSYAISDLLS